MADTALAERSEPALTPKRDYSRLTRGEVAALLQLHKDGFTQTEIAQRLNCNQRTVGRWLEELTDSTDSAKAYLRGNALKMAQNVVKKGRAVDHVAALKGLSVLHEEQSSGVTVIVGGGGTVNIGVLSPAKVGVESERLEK